ncbi:MAG: hypothetical protein GX650_00530 [Clostridiales bacterium]|jgi:hypothetical protein|nr:hypothetical protein [Clostridiales bacterium]
MAGCAWEGFFSSAQLARWQEVIALRFSCRKFQAAADIQQLSALHYAAGRVALPGLRVELAECDSTRLFRAFPLIESVEYASHYMALIIQPEVPHALLHAGIAGEALVLEATAQGLGTCWIQGTYRRSAVQIALQPGERVAAVIPYGQPADPQGASRRRRKPLQALCLDDPATWPNWSYQAAEAVRAAPSALNGQPWRFSHAGNTMRLSGSGFGNLNYGIAVLHILCALHQVPHYWRWGEGQKSLLIRREE